MLACPDCESKDRSRTKGMPHRLGDALDTSYFDTESLGEQPYFSYERMGPTDGVQVGISTVTQEFPKPINKKRYTVSGGNQTLPLA